MHNIELDEVFFVQKFLDGLRYNISNAIVLHKPRTVYASLSLALMQEDLLESASKGFSSRSRDNKFSGRPSTQLNTRPASPSGILGTTPVTDKNASKPKWDDKLQVLRAAWRAKELCMKCGDQYNPHHKCPQLVPMHVMEEVLEVLKIEQTTSSDSESESQESDQEVLSLSSFAAEGVQGKKTIRLQALFQNQEILLLVDSGSSGTFVSEALVEKTEDSNKSM